MTQDRPTLGIALMLGFCVVAPMGDAIAKILSNKVALGQLLLVRFGVQAVVLIPIIAVTGRVWRMSQRVLVLTVLRTLMHIVGIGMMVSALYYLPLADAIAIAFVMPFMMLLLGHYVLGEEVGMRRMIACAVGFLGTLLVIQPSFQEVGWPALLPMGVAVNFALFMLVTRKIAKETDPIGLQAVSGVIALALMAPILFLVPDTVAPILAWDSLLPSSTWTLLVAIGLSGTLAHLLMTWSLRYAPSTTLAPMQYLEIPIATIIGFAVFGDLPNTMASVGILIVMASGLYIVFREQAMSRQPEPVPVAERTVQTPAE
ncbi:MULTISPECIES: DMT family transporter [Marivita]|uniref:DMT family transporter n=1 Tax=Marivita cryptomonadis TaxID=505252 RepID=A0A9Q2RYC4_9RHOB|nr:MULTISPECIES: DMT family transporter [Marivita]MCR9169007.1 DMT family transporter [Paracoccaceae bacterium]MBM2320358.1 DMT family transporter [Marivita cryptomonadis]MBM2329938.1 DMT family transporter [Marivita cryptomonadis]MBM2339525.1 DMT family transporter [Marivita cryptomonadis]MBM2344184.1 DMT family transporter [Marivita cryptomonadis]